jgi:hypothetical protein
MKDKDKEKKELPEQEIVLAIKDSMVPQKNPDVTFREEMEENGKYMLFNAENELILVVNATGKFIIDNCDGSKTIVQLINAIKDNYVIAEDMHLPEIVKGYIITLLKARLITIEGCESGEQ